MAGPDPPGAVEFRGKEIPVTAIVGVDFKASEVKEPGENSPSQG